MINEELKDVESYFENDLEINIQLKSFDEFEYNESILKELGYKFIKKESRTFYYEKDKTIKLTIYNNNLTLDTMMPNYNESMVNLTSSIKKYYNKEITYPTSSKLDKYLNKDYRHILFLILDGLGPYVIEKSLSKGDILFDNLKEKISAVFPPTTACAIPCSASGKLCVETGWLGWQNYIKELNMNVSLFTGSNYVTDENTGVNIRNTYIPYDDYFYSLGVDAKDLEPSFRPDGFDTFDDMMDEFVKRTKLEHKTFTYAYWAEPDKAMHQYGVFFSETTDTLKYLNNVLEDKLKDINDDTLVIITADHGHQDVLNIPLYNYQNLYNMLNRLPSNEGRSLTFSVKEGKKEEFKHLFNHYFDDYFILLTKEEFINQGYFGDVEKYGYNKRLDDFLGDFIAVAINEFSFDVVPKPYKFKSAHAGLTKNEMETPLIIIKK